MSQKIEITPEQVIDEVIITRLRNKKHYLGFVAGETGSAKSWSSIRIGEMVTEQYNTPEPFSIDDVVFNALDFIKRFKQLQQTKNGGRGSLIVWDEAGTSINAREAMSGTNITIGNIFEMIRFQQVSCLWTVPSINLVDITLRRLTTGLMLCIPIDRTSCPGWQRQMSTFRWYLVQQGRNPASKENDLITQCPRIPIETVNRAGEHFTRSVRVPQVWIGKANADLLKQYESKKRAYFDGMMEKSQKKLEAIERKQNAKMGISNKLQPVDLSQPFIPAGTQPVNAAQSTSSALQRLSGRRVS